MAGTKPRLKINGTVVQPQAALDNIVEAVGSTVYVQLPKLDSQGKIETQYLPSYVDDIVDLVAIASTAPSTCAEGDRYYNSGSNNLKIYTATAANTWGTTGATPEKDKIYVNVADSKIYRWSGTAMVEISKQVSTVTSIRAASSALDTVVPTEKAVAAALSGKAASSHTHTVANVTGLQDALDAKQAALTAGTNISISSGTVSCTYSLPTAAASTLGGVKIGTNISISSGTISVASGSTSAKGVVQLATVAEATAGTIETKAVTPKGLKTELDKKQDALTAGTNISISSGTVSVADATTSTKGVVTLGDDTAIANSNSSSPGGAAQCYAVKQYVADQLDAKQDALTAGTNISISSGTVSCTYSLPTASASTLGGVKIGTNISISSGTISVANGSTSAKGVVQLATVAEATAGTIETKAVTPKGLKTELDKKQDALTAGTNISISSGTVSCTYSLPTAAASTLGGVKIGSNISISSGVISVADATTSVKGVVTLGDDTAIANSNSSSPGGAAQCYAVKQYVADQLDARITVEFVD